MTLAEVAGAAYVPENLPEGMEPGLEETTFYDPTNFTWPFGAHACIVDVDAETGKVDVVRYVSVDDCGPAINPMLIEGQIHGGVVHGIGQALYERIHYDDDGQLVTGTFVDYALPSAADVPSFETDRTETPSPVNSLVDMPLSPQRIWMAIRDAQGRPAPSEESSQDGHGTGSAGSGPTHPSEGGLS
jgi:carbon-monoxide dehydrogenase large subunit